MTDADVLKRAAELAARDVAYVKCINNWRKNDPLSKISLDASTDRRALPLHGLRLRGAPDSALAYSSDHDENFGHGNSD